MDFASLGLVLLAVVAAFVVIYGIALFSERGTEVLKALSGWLAKIPALGFINIQGAGSFVVSLLFAAAVVYGFHVDVISGILSALHITLDPTLVSALEAIITWLLSNVLHDSGKLPALRKS